MNLIGDFRNRLKNGVLAYPFSGLVGRVFLLHLVGLSFLARLSLLADFLTAVDGLKGWKGNVYNNKE